MKNIIVVLGVAAALAAGAHVSYGQNQWKRNAAPAETYITDGGWTLEQSGAAVGLKSAGYCDKNGKQVKNPGTQRMQPYYFPFITGHGKHRRATSITARKTSTKRSRPPIQKMQA